MKAKDVIKRLRKEGWLLANGGSGGHLFVYHQDKPGFRVPVPMHSGDLSIGTLKSIEKMTGVKF